MTAERRTPPRNALPGSIVDRVIDLGEARRLAQDNGWREKVLIYVTRDPEELLVLEHTEDYPDAGIQVPAGTLDAGEMPAQTAVRELAEETGVSSGSAPVYLESRVRATDEVAFHVRHFFWINVPRDLPDRWTHEVTGGGIDDGMLFHLTFRDRSTPGLTHGYGWESALVRLGHVISAAYPVGKCGPPPTLWGVSLYEIPLTTLDGQPTSLAEYAGRALLVVNVASKCGMTPQYASLEQLQKEYADRGLTVVGFPCNQFGGQEPGTNEEIAQFCATTYGVTFPMTDKVKVNGSGQHPIFTELTQVGDSTGTAGDVRWNFEKWVIDPQGTPVARYRSHTEPTDPEVVRTIESVLPREN